MKLNEGKILLGAIYVILVIIVSFRIIVHPTCYTTPDSIAYLKQGEKIKNAITQGGIFTTIHEVKEGYTLWPVGYSYCTALVSIVTKTSMLTSSKIVNLTFLGLLFVLLYNWFGNKTWFLALTFFSYGSMEVISETWSETPFIFFVFLLGYIIANDRRYSSIPLTFALTATLVLLFLYRYIGIVYLLMVATVAIRHYMHRKKNWQAYVFALILSSIFVFYYLYGNKLNSGYYTGGERIFIGHQGFFEFLWQLIQGLFNEFSIARNYSFKGGAADLPFIFLLILQFVVIFYLVMNKSYLKSPIVLGKATKVLLILSAGYLACIVMLRIFIPFDNFDFRIFFPFTVPLFIGMLSIIIENSQKDYFRKVSWIIVFFMLLSLTVNLPKTYILESIKNIFTSNTGI